MSEPSVVLGIDCATSHLALALVEEGGRVLARVAPDVGREHAARIVRDIAGLFQTAGIERQRVRAIGVGVGPGSYTGLRVAIATANGLARAWSVPVFGASTLAAVAAAALAAGEQGVAVLDARRGNVYAALVRRDDDAERAGDGARAGAFAPRVRLVAGPVKVARDALPAAFAGERTLAEAAPDAAALALAAVATAAPAEATYL